MISKIACESESLVEAKCSTFFRFKKCPEDFERTPALLRKTRTELDLDEGILMASLFLWCVAQATTAASTDEERTFLDAEAVAQFLNGSLDSELKDFIMTQPESFQYSMLSIIRTAQEIGDVSFQQVACAKETVAAQQLMTSTFEDLMGKAQGDQARLMKYSSEYKRWADAVTLQSEKYKRALYEDGSAAVAKFMDAGVRFGCHFTHNGKPISREYSDQKTRPTRYQETVMDFIKTAVYGTGGAVDPNNVFVVHVLDYIVYQSVSKTVFHDTAAAVGSMIHTSEKHVNLTILPMAFGGCSGAHHIKHRREIEDTLLGHGMDISICASVTFGDHDVDTDRRCLSNWSVLGMKVIKDNAFRNCAIGRGRSGGEHITLIRSKDMYACEPYADDLPFTLTKPELTRGSRIVPPTERHRQRGVAATSVFINDLIKGTTAEIPPRSLICIIDYNPSAAADWASAVLSMQMEQMSANDNAAFPHKLACFTFGETQDMSRQIEARLAAQLYGQWFDGSISLPSIGRVKSKTMPDSEMLPEPEQPDFKLGYLAKNSDGGFTLGFPTGVATKFQINDGIMKRWEARPLVGYSIKCGRI